MGSGALTVVKIYLTIIELHELFCALLEIMKVGPSRIARGAEPRELSVRANLSDL